MKHLLFILIVMMTLGACTENKINTKAYYFPLEELQPGKVYEYHTRGENDSIYDVRYKYYLSMETDSGQFLINNNYNALFFNDQLVTNRVVSNGILLEKYQMMAMDSMGKTNIVDAEVVKSNTFPFTVKKEGGVTPMEMEYVNPQDKRERIRFVRERKYVGDTIFVFKGKKIPAVLFEANEVRELKHSEEGDYQDISYTNEIYAKGLGLVEKQYNIGEMKMKSVLQDTFSMKRLEKMAQEYWQQGE